MPLLMTGLAMVAMGFISPVHAITRLTRQVSLALISLVVTLVVAEGIFRVVGFDFSGGERAWRRVPPYYRQPTEPSGAVFFRRSGPERWTGQVLNTRLRQLGVLPNPYANEPAITVSYDRNGFRNPEGMSDWQIAVAGDSSTELGYLADDQLFTSILSHRLEAPVLNLGVSYTGPVDAVELSG